MKKRSIFPIFLAVFGIFMGIEQTVFAIDEGEQCAKYASCFSDGSEDSFVDYSEEDPSEGATSFSFHSFKIDSDKASIFLENGFELEWFLNPCEKEMLTLWKEGDLVEFSVNLKTGTLLLINPMSEVAYAPSVNLKASSVAGLPKIAKIEIIKNDSFGYEDVKDVYLFLTNGTAWKKRVFDETEAFLFSYWNKDDSVIITFEEEENTIVMINQSLIMTENFAFAEEYFYLEQEE